MRKINLIPAAIMAIAITGAAMTGCQKDHTTPAGSPQTNATDDAGLRTIYDNATAEASYDDIGNVANEGAFFHAPGFNHLLTSCATVTIELNMDPHRAVIDYGTKECLSNDGNYRRGKIIVTWTGNYRDPGTVITITPDNYYLNFNKIEGTKTITNTTRNADGMLTYAIKVNGTVSVDPQYSPDGVGGKMTYTASKTLVWAEGEATPRWDDDVYLISGTAEGTNTANVTYTSTTDPKAPLRKEIGFPHFTSGILYISNGLIMGPAPLVMDYSYINGQRDDLARVTNENGKTYTINLGMRNH